MNTKTPILSQSQRSYLLQLSFESWFLWCSMYGVVKHVCLRANIEEKFCFAFFSIFFTCFIFSRTILFSRNNSINLRKLDISLSCSLYIHKGDKQQQHNTVHKYTTSTFLSRVLQTIHITVHNKYTISTQPVHNPYTTSTQPVHNQYTTSKQQVHNQYTTSTFLSRVLYTYTG